jgi:hypothetical protein
MSVRPEPGSTENVHEDPRDRGRRQNPLNRPLWLANALLAATILALVGGLTASNIGSSLGVTLCWAGGTFVATTTLGIKILEFVDNQSTDG